MLGFNGYLLQLFFECRNRLRIYIIWSCRTVEILDGEDDKKRYPRTGQAETWVAFEKESKIICGPPLENRVETRLDGEENYSVVVVPAFASQSEWWNHHNVRTVARSSWRSREPERGVQSKVASSNDTKTEDLKDERKKCTCLVFEASEGGYECDRSYCMRNQLLQKEDLVVWLRDVTKWQKWWTDSGWLLLEHDHEPSHLSWVLLDDVQPGVT